MPRRCGVRCYSIPPLTPYVARPWRSRSSPCQRVDTGDAEEVCTSYWRPPEKHNPTLTRPPPPAYPADPTGERSSPECLVCEFPVVQREEDRQYSKARAGPEEREEGITPGGCLRPPPYHRHTEEAEPRGQVYGHFIGLREHDSQAHIIRQAFDPGGAGGRERGEPRGPPGSWRRVRSGEARTAMI